MNISSSVFESTLIQEISGLSLSPSHSQEHIKLVLGFAYELQLIYGGDIDTICAAAILHDLGRSNPHLDDDKSIEFSIQKAKEILLLIKFPMNKIEDVLKAIQDHDKPSERPRTLEGRILKDADFLAGFGAWGVLRVAMWLGERQEGIPKFFDTVNEKMPERIQGLEFWESKITALREMKFVNLFKEYLNLPPKLLALYPGKYIILEGNSGVGKNTQAERLKALFDAKGIKSIIVQEPSEEFYRKIEDYWKEKFGTKIKDDRSKYRSFLLLADRTKQIFKTVAPALNNGLVVISVRSYMSMLVYQGQSQYDRSYIDFLHQFVPRPDLILLYDADERVCFERIAKRGGEISSYDKLGTIKKFRPMYLGMTKSDYFDCPVEIIDASQEIEEVTEMSWRTINKHIHY